MSLITRYSDTIQGAMTFTGNTVGLSKEANTNNAGVIGSIGAFTSLDLTQSVTDFPPGTTLDIARNGSSAQLVIPPGSTIVYAELVWGGNYFGRSSVTNETASIAGLINDPVVFTTPLGTQSISQDPATAQEFFDSRLNEDTGFFSQIGWYARSQDVTALVQAAGPGTYSVEQIPGLTEPLDGMTRATNHAGWTLGVVYANPDLPYRNMNLFAGTVPISINQTSAVDVTVSGFITPPIGPVNARFLLSAQEGDADIGGDQVFFGETVDTLALVSGPNNPPDNFFGSQINNDAGLLNPIGTFGSLNQDPFSQTNIPAGRQGWDITNIDASNQVTNDQTQAVLRVTTEGDAYMVNLVGIQIDAFVADLSIIKTATPPAVVAGEQIVYTLEVNNAGPYDAPVTIVTDDLPIEIGGAEYSLDGGSTWLLWTGAVDLGTVAVDETRTILIRGTVSPAATNELSNTAFVEADIFDPNPDNNQSTIRTPIEPLADLAIIKTNTVSPVVAGEAIAYTLQVTNEGPSNAVNVVVSDDVVADIENPEYSLDGGNTWLPWIGSLNLGTLEPQSSRTIGLRGTVSTSATGTLINTATVTSDTEDPDLNNNTSTTTDPIEPSADLEIIKTNTTTTVVAGEMVTYTLQVSNQGPSDAVNVVVSDDVVANIENPEYSIDGGNTWLPWTGNLNLGTLEPQNSRNIGLRGIVSTSATGTLINTAAVTSETPDPNPDNNTSTTTDPIETSADLEITKVGTPNPITPGEMLNYLITVTNNGPSDAQNASLTDEIPQALQNPEYSLNNGATWQAWTGTIALGTIAASTSRTIRIRGIVSEDVVPPLVNTAIVTSDTPDPNPDNNTDTATTLINAITIEKTSTVEGAIVGDTVPYTLTIRNNGEVTAEAVIVTDPLTPALAYAGNLRLNGVPINGIITAGVAIGDLPPGGVATLTFDTTVLTVPEGKIITNQATMSYVYRIDETAPPIPGSETSNPVDVIVYTPSIEVTKSANQSSVEVGEVFEYTMNVTNTGDILLNDVVVEDVLPPSFMVQNITLDGVAVNGIISEGINIGTLQIGQTKVVKVTAMINDTVDIDSFNNLVEVTGRAPIDPNRPPEIVTDEGEDEAGIIIYNPKLVLEKSADQIYAVEGDTVTYTIKATNEGNVDLNNIDFDAVNLFDTLPSQLEFIAGSVTLDGVALPQANILAGVSIGELLVNQTKTVTFKVKVVSGVVTPIVNTAKGNYTYQLPGRPRQEKTEESNEVELNVNRAAIDIVKKANKETVNLGDTVVYTVEVANTGNLIAYNILFSDTLPEQVKLIPGTFKINDVVVNGIELEKGIILPMLAPGETVVVTYEVEVISSKCSGLLINQAQVIFEYRFPDGSGGTLTVTGEASTATVELTLTTFKQMSIETYLQIPEVKPDIETINEATGIIEVSSCHVIATPQAISTEGQKLTGYKLIIKGVLNFVIEYTALEETQSVHSAHYSIPFSAFVILPPDYVIGSKIDVTGLVEDIYYNAIDTRTFFINVTALMNVKILSC